MQFSRIMFKSSIHKCLRQLARTYCDVPEGVFKRAEKSVNKVTLLGRTGRDAELRGSQKHPVVVFNVATPKDFKRADGSFASRTEWHRVSVFIPGLRDHVAAFIRKGDRVFVSGSLSYNSKTDEDGRITNYTSILADDIINLTKRYLNEDSSREVEDE